MTEKLEKSNSSDTIHVLVDNSNVYLGAQNRNGKQNKNIRVHIGRLVAHIEGQRDCKTREVVGTISAAKVIDEWAKHGYTVNTPPIITKKEIFADGTLRELLFRCAIDYKGQNHTLVLVTGDGNTNESKGNFPDCVEMALRLGWKVEIWGWKRSLNAKYFKLRETYGKLINIFKLDKARDFITWTCPLISPSTTPPKESMVPQK